MAFVAALAPHNESNNVPTKVKLIVPRPWSEMRFHLVTHDPQGAIWQEPREQPQPPADARGIGKNTVEGHQRGDRRKERQKSIKGHTGGDQQDTVFLNALKHAPAYVPPALGGNVLWRGSRAPAVARRDPPVFSGSGCLEPDKARNMPTAAAASHKGFSRELSLRDWTKLTKRIFL